MNYKKYDNETIENILTTNLSDWKRKANIEEVLKLNNKLLDNDIGVICSPEFYDDLYTESLDIVSVLDKHFLNEELSVFSKETFTVIQDIYNI